jgi:predicted dehydrogenase
MLKIGVIGTGHLGRIHLDCISRIDDLQIVGFHDSSLSTSEEISNKYDLRHYADPNELIRSVDMVDVVTPTVSHLDYINSAMRSGKHVFVEKPVVANRQEIKILRDLHQDYPRLKVQIGHVERFNPVYTAFKKYRLEPKFIEVHRLASFKPRSLDISVVLDLMIHDLDLICDIVKSPIVSVQANGVCLVNSSADICNARINFANDCVANVTASRISMKNMRKFRIFSENAYYSLDFLDKQLQVISLEDNIGNVSGKMQINTFRGPRWLNLESPEIQEENAIEEELRSFVRSIKEDLRTKVDLEDGIGALELALEIEDKIGIQKASVR